MNSEFHSHLKNIFGMKYHTHSQWQLLDLERNTDKCHLNTSGDIAPKIAEVLQYVNPTTFFHCACWNLRIIDEVSFSILFWMQYSRTWRISTVDKKPFAETNQNLSKSLKWLASYCLQWIVESWCAQQVLKASLATWFTSLSRQQNHLPLLQNKTPQGAGRSTFSIVLTILKIKCL